MMSLFLAFLLYIRSEWVCIHLLGKDIMSLKERVKLVNCPFALHTAICYLRHHANSPMYMAKLKVRIADRQSGEVRPYITQAF